MQLRFVVIILVLYVPMYHGMVGERTDHLAFLMKKEKQCAGNKYEKFHLLFPAVTACKEGVVMYGRY